MSFPTRSFLLALGMGCGLLAGAPPAGAEDQPDGLRDALTRFLHDEAEAVVHIRSYFLDRINLRPFNNAAWAGGGWIGLRRNTDTLVTGIAAMSLLPPWLALLLVGGAALIAWRREGQ